MTAEAKIAKVVPGLIVAGDPGAQRNRDQIYRAIKAISFDDSGETYQIPNVELTTGTALFPAEVTFPMRNPDLDEGEGHWFVGGEKLTVEVDVELEAAPTGAVAKLYVGLYFDPVSTTTLANVLVDELVTATTFQVQLATVAGTMYRYRWTMDAMGPQEQWATLEMADALTFSGGTATVSSSATTTPRTRVRTKDFSTTTQRNLMLYTNVQVTDAADLTVADLRLRRVSAYFEGIQGQNE